MRQPVGAVVNCDPCMDRFSEPLPVVKHECCCGVVVGDDDEGAECLACDADICEQCADANHCRNGDCENTYCDKCAVGFLQATDGGVCVPCVNEFMRVPAAQFFRALGRTG